jgi:hypothetical protein
MDFSIQGLMQAAKQQGQLADTTNKQLTDISSMMTDAANSIMSAIGQATDGGGNTPLSLETKLLGEQQAQQAKQDFRKAIGDDPETSAKLSNILATTYAETTRKAQEQQAAITQKEQVGLFDDPLQFLVNYVTLPDERNALKATQDQASSAATALRTMNAMMDERNKIENDYSIKLTDASIASQVQGLKANLDVMAGQTKMQTLSNQAHLLTTIMNAGEEQVKNISNVISARNQAAHLALAEESAAQNRVRFNAWLEDYKDDKVAQQEQFEMYNRGAAISGKPPAANAQELQRLLKKSGQDVSAKTQAIMEIGFNNALDGTSALGATPADAAVTIQKLGIRLPSEQNYAANVFNSALEAMKKDPTTANIKDPKQYNAVFNKKVQEIFASYSQNLNFEDPTNPLTPPSVKFMGENSSFGKTPLFQKVLGPQQVDTANPQKIMDIGLQAVKDKKLTVPELVSGYTQYYNQALSANSVNRGFNKFGFAFDPKAVSSKLELHPAPSQIMYDNKGLAVKGGVVGTLFGRNPTLAVNLGDETSVTNYIARELSVSKPANLSINTMGKYLSVFNQENQ